MTVPMPSMETLYDTLLDLAGGDAERVARAIPSHEDGKADASGTALTPGGLGTIALTILAERFGQDIPGWLWTLNMPLSLEIRDPLRELANGVLPSELAA